MRKMKRFFAVLFCMILAAFALAGCETTPGNFQAGITQLEVYEYTVEEIEAEFPFDFTPKGGYQCLTGIRRKGGIYKNEDRIFAIHFEEVRDCRNFYKQCEDGIVGYNQEDYPVLRKSSNWLVCGTEDAVGDFFAKNGRWLNKYVLGTED